MIEICEFKEYDLLAEMNEEVQQLHHGLYPEIFKPYNKNEVVKFFKEALSNENVKAFVAIENEKILGYALLFINDFEENPFQYKRKFIILDQILVLKSERSKGIGKRLLEKTFSFAKSLNINTVELNHWTKNDEARLFFNKNGFKYHKEIMSKSL